MFPIVSIIIASYNSGRVIDFALRSILSQSFQDWECIVVDGSSTDNTLEIINKYEAKDHRFHHISEKDNGIYDAFNKGWKLAKGEWVHYLGSDDELTPNGLTDLLAKDVPPNVAIISGDVYCRHIDGSLKLNKSIGFGGCHQGKLTRKKVLEELGGFDEKYRIVSDADLKYRIQNRKYDVVNVPTVVAYFSMDGASQSIKHLWLVHKELYFIYKNNKVYNYPLFIIIKLFIRSLINKIYESIITIKR